MGKGVEIPCIEGVKIPCLGGRYTMGRVKIPRIGVNIFCIEGSKYHGSGVKIPCIRGSKYHEWGSIYHW
jgi:hypothetical protein